MVVRLPTGCPFTIDDLDRFPEDGARYELIEGSLHVTPSPAVLHQQVSARLFRLLDGACPTHLQVLYAPLDIVLGPATVLIPDLVVLPADTDEPHRITTPPVVVVEILSPSTKAYDLGTKRHVYGDAGVGAYWVVDPTEPSVHLWTWGDQPDERRAEGDEVLRVGWPFPVEVRPSDLVRRR